MKCIEGVVKDLRVSDDTKFIWTGNLATLYLFTPEMLAPVEASCHSVTFKKGTFATPVSCGTFPGLIGRDLCKQFIPEQGF